MAVSVRDFIKHRRDRALGSILGAAERSSWWERLKPAEREAFRQKVLDSINGYHDVVLDLVKAEDAVFNEEALGLLERIDRNTRTQAAAAD